ncbi:type VI secretion system Vgr family protein [Pendulispora albinea]|uniref:Type VI secretion system tip protein VgrG n=1 Tax=Pendulispora albinea TaxID=2741071 RepID=A0ABZ2MA29_9BACT
MVHDDIGYELTIVNVKDSLLRVASFEAVEELSSIFAYTIVVATDPDPEAIASLEAALGSDARFAVTKGGDVSRIVHGIITRVQPDGAFKGETQARVVFVLEPRLANLRHRGGFRIFQNMAMHEIVLALCDSEQIKCSWLIKGRPPKREYCTQFNESDFAFIRRLASDEGMHFYFTHDDEETTLTFANDPGGYPEIEPKIRIPFNDTIGAVDSEHVRSIRRSQNVRVGAFEHRDYNFLEPNNPLVARAETAGKETAANSHKREFRDYPGWSVQKDGEGKARAQMRLDELRSDASVVAGTALSLRLSPGRTFTLEGHREDGFNRKLLVTGVRMSGAVQGALRDGSGVRGGTRPTEFKAVPAEVTIHPKRRPKPQSRLQSARVVGPKDGDPYVDERGRVKVQFFWDRDGKFDENSSCWIRMMTPAAHLDEGFWQAHKVGSEVVVGFIDDDIDRPMILGAVYNTVQPQLYPLPAQVAKSVWRTNSIPGNKGFNEITQDNTAGREVIFLHAQKDHKEVVLHNHMESIGANQTSSVGANQTVSVGANRSVSVGANHTVTVTANETNTVHGKRTEKVDTGEDVTVKAGRTHTVETGDEKLSVKAGKRAVSVSAEDSLTADSKKDKVTTTFDLDAGTSITIHHGKDSTLTLKENTAELNTAKEIKLTNSKSTITLKEGVLSIEATDEIALKAGPASISLKNDGTVTISGATKVGIGCQSSTVNLEPAQAVVNGAAVNVTASGVMEISGAMIKIN